MNFDIGLLRGVLTLVLFLAFIGLWIWAFSRHRKDDFERLAHLPLEEDAPGRSQS